MKTKILSSTWPHMEDDTQAALDGPLARVHTLSNAIEAQVLHDVLLSADIDHVVQSYRDSAYDSLFQQSYGWGVIITREKDAARTLQAIKEALAHFEEESG